jgi:hypothetical protein
MQTKTFAQLETSVAAQQIRNVKLEIRNLRYKGQQRTSSCGFTVKSMTRL